MKRSISSRIYTRVYPIKTVDNDPNSQNLQNLPKFIFWLIHNSSILSCLDSFNIRPVWMFSPCSTVETSCSDTLGAISFYYLTKELLYDLCCKCSLPQIVIRDKTTALQSKEYHLWKSLTRESNFTPPFPCSPCHPLSVSFRPKSLVIHRADLWGALNKPAGHFTRNSLTDTLHVEFTGWTEGTLFVFFSSTKFLHS